MVFVLSVAVSQRHSRYKRVCKVEKSDYLLRHVCRYVWAHGTTRLKLDGFSWKIWIAKLLLQTVEEKKTLRWTRTKKICDFKQRSKKTIMTVFGWIIPELKNDYGSIWLNYSWIKKRLWQYLAELFLNEKTIMAVFGWIIPELKNDYDSIWLNYYWMKKRLWQYLAELFLN